MAHLTSIFGPRNRPSAHATNRDTESDATCNTQGVLQNWCGKDDSLKIKVIQSC